MSELVLAGLPTTSTRTSRLATASKALPCAEKILAFSSNRSLRSIPGPRGLAPTSIAKLQSLNPTLASDEAVTLFKVAKAQSFSSITTPCTAALAAGISKRFKLIGWSAPSIWPEATRNASA